MKVHIDREAHYIYVEDTKDIFLDTFHIGRYLGVYAPGQDWNIRGADFLTLEELNGLRCLEQEGLWGLAQEIINLY